MARLALAAAMLLAACDASRPLQAGVNMRGGTGPIDEIGITATQGGDITISGEASLGVSGSL